MIAALNLVMPYNVAFKLVTVSGPLMLPAAAYYFAKGMRTPWPAPPAFAIAAFGTLVQTRTDWQIYGGNIASTLAGEFSFAIGLAFALFGLGALAYTLDTGKRRVAARRVLIALAIMSHIVVAIFVGDRGVPALAHAPPAAHVARSRSRSARRRLALDRGLAAPAARGNRRTRRACGTTKLLPTGNYKLPSWMPLPGPVGTRSRVSGTRSASAARHQREPAQAHLADAVVAVVDLAPRRRRDHRGRLVPPPVDARARRARARHRGHVRRVARARDLEHALPPVLAAHRGRSSRRWARPRSRGSRRCSSRARVHVDTRRRSRDARATRVGRRRAARRRRRRSIREAAQGRGVGAGRPPLRPRARRAGSRPSDSRRRPSRSAGAGSARSCSRVVVALGGMFALRPGYEAPRRQPRRSRGAVGREWNYSGYEAKPPSRSTTRS